MHALKYFSILALLCNVTTSERFVLELNDKNFDIILEDYEAVLVLFYAPWCRHCQNLHPQYEEAAKALVTAESVARLMKIDCTGPGRATCNKYKNEGYPTMKLFRHGKFTRTYQGDRTATGIVEFMRRQVEPFTYLQDSDSYQSFLEVNSDEVVLIGIFEDDTDLKEAFIQTSKTNFKVTYGLSSSQDVMGDQTMKEGIVLIRPVFLHNTFENNSVIFDGEATEKSISAFIATNYHGLVGYRKFGNRLDFKNPLVIAYYDVDYVKNPKNTHYWRNRILKVASLFQNNFNFAVSCRNEFYEELEDYSIDQTIDSSKPIIVVRDEKYRKYVMRTNFSVDALTNFLHDILNQTIRPFIRSEEIPRRNNGLIKIAVAKNFDDVVMKNAKDTMIMFHSPSCGHCRNLSPIYEKLAERLKNEDIAFVQMDATQNDVPEMFDIQGYPMVYWLARDSKHEAVEYKWERKVEEFIRFISKHATKELEEFDRDGNPKVKKSEL